MNNVQAYKTPNLTIINGQVKTTSLAIAELFGKRHDHVLRDIETIKANCSSEFSERNFAFSTYTHHLPKSGEVEYKCIDLTRDGMTMIIMGYTGVEAMRFKEAYITAFNKMESELMRLQALPHTVKKSIQSTQNIDLVKQNVLKVIARAGVNGIYESRLMQSCAGFSRLTQAQKNELLQSVSHRLITHDSTNSKRSGKKGRKFFIK